MISLHSGQYIHFRSGYTLISEWNEDDLEAYCIANIRTRNMPLAIPELRMTCAEQKSDGWHVQFEMISIPEAPRTAALVDAHRGFSVWHAAREYIRHGGICPQEFDDTFCTKEEQINTIVSFLRDCPSEGEKADELATRAARTLADIVYGTNNMMTNNKLLYIILSMRCSRAALTAVASRLHGKVAARAAAAYHWTVCQAVIWSGARVDDARSIVMRAAANGNIQTVIAVIARGLYMSAEFFNEREMLAELLEQTPSASEKIELLDALITDSKRTQSSRKRSGMIASLAHTIDEIRYIVDKCSDAGDWEPADMPVDHFDGQMAVAALHMFPQLVWRAIRDGDLRAEHIRFAHVLPHMVFLATDDKECSYHIRHCQPKLVAESMSQHNRLENVFSALCRSPFLRQRHIVAQALFLACTPDALDPIAFAKEAIASLDISLVGALLVVLPHVARYMFRIIRSISISPHIASDMMRVAAPVLWDLECV